MRLTSKILTIVVTVTFLLIPCYEAVKGEISKNAAAGKSESSSFDASKIEANLFSEESSITTETEEEETKDVIVTFGSDKDLKEIGTRIQNKHAYSTKAERIYAMYEAMHGYSSKCQGDAQSYLESGSYEHHGMWSSNTMLVKNADRGCVQKLAGMKDVTFIGSDKIVKMSTGDSFKVTELKSKFLLEEKENGDATTTGNEDQNTPPSYYLPRLTWGLNIMNVPEAWSYSPNSEYYYGKRELKQGKGIVVGVIDSGVNLKHETLKNNFRKYAGWKDGYGISSTPVDLYGHGTFTTGVAVGSHGIGVAPGAQWIHCRGCLDEVRECKTSALLKCCHFMICPHDKHNQTEPDSYKNCYTAPDLVSNSWGDRPGRTVYNRCLLSLRAAGIIPIFSIGNSGAKCNTANSPGDSEYVIGVGATDPDDMLAWFSSVGPAKSGILKPDLAAPGVDVISGWIGGPDVYIYGSGTSASCPFVAGTIALMLERCRLPYNSILGILKETAERDALGVTDQICGGTKSDVFPNNFYGSGRVNAFEAIKKVLEVCQPNYYRSQPPPQQYGYSHFHPFYNRLPNHMNVFSSNNRYQRSSLPVPYSPAYLRYFPYSVVYN